VKVRADMLISGMKNAQAAVAAEDFKDLLARNGLNLIAERIENEKSVVQLLDYSVDFGQGYLFGEPRPIRDMADTHDRAPKRPPASRRFPRASPVASRGRTHSDALTMAARHARPSA